MNQFDTKILDSSDIQNHNVYKASSYAVSASFSAGVGDQDSAKTEEQQRAARGAAKTTPGGSAGAGRVSVSETSTTSPGISGIAGDVTVRTGDASSTGALVKDWNAQALLKDVEAQARITQEFGQHASRAVGDYAQQKYTELMYSDPAEAAKWAEGGAYRVAAHAAVGALTGGLNGSVGAGASAYVAATIGKSIDDMDLPAPVKQMLGAASAAAVGAIGGGTAGAVTGFAVDLNNRQQHPTERQALQANAKVFATHLQELGYSSMTEERALAILQEQVDNRIDYTQANRLDTATMDPYIHAQASKFLNALSSSLGSYDDGRGHQIRYFNNVTADGERLLGDYRDPSINAIPHFPPVDYVALQGGALGINGGISINTYNSEIFIGGAKSTMSAQFGGSLVVGRILHGEADPIERAKIISKVLDGASIQSSICAGGLCFGINQSIGPKGSNPATAVEAGIGTPGISGGAGVSISPK